MRLVATGATFPGDHRKVLEGERSSFVRVTLEACCLVGMVGHQAEPGLPAMGRVTVDTLHRASSGLKDVHRMGEGLDESGRLPRVTVRTKSVRRRPKQHCGRFRSMDAVATRARHGVVLMGIGESASMSGLVGVATQAHSGFREGLSL